MSAPKRLVTSVPNRSICNPNSEPKKQRKMKKFLALTVLAGAVLFSPAPQAADFDRVYETGTPLKAPRAMPNFRELKHALKMPQFDLKTIYGKNVWATWCRPCVAEIPELITALNALKNSDVRVIGVAVDGGNVVL